jgi:ADP-sugar diphosphatase
MTHRVNAIDDEIRKCMGQLQSIQPNASFPNRTQLGAIQEITRNNMVNTINVAGRPVQIVCDITFTRPIDEIYRKILEFPAFVKWVEGFESDFFKVADMTVITIKQVKMFGPRIGFLIFETNMDYKQDYKDAYMTRAFAAGTIAPKNPEIPSFVFMRGGSVAILVIITDPHGKRYSLLVTQPRMAIGKLEMSELPAGMIDDSNYFGGTAAKEMKEETGIEINASDLEDLTDGMDYSHAYPSCGGCDEFMKFYLFRCKMTQKKLRELQDKCTGAYAEGENIKVKVVEFERLAEFSPDMKTLSALYLYEKRCKRRSVAYIPGEKPMVEIK